MKHTTIFCLFASSLLLLSCNGGKKAVSSDPWIDDVVSNMTLDEKIRTVVGTSMETVVSSNRTTIGVDGKIIKGSAGTTFPIERLGVPAIVLADGPAGLRISPTREGEDRTYYCTYFPIGTVLSSTWNQELIEQVGKSIGEEVRDYGVDVLLAPALNIQRNPLCGRNFEYYSEDPLISGKTAAAYVRGIQSNDVGACIKHYAVNSQETNRKMTNAIVSDRALREIYLKGFEIAVKEAAPWTLMTSYNSINGTTASENTALIEGILRGEWGYDGTVMTDWYAGDHSENMVVAGNDMIQPGTRKQYDDIENAIKNGTLDESLLDRNVKRIFSLVKRTPRYNGYKFSNNPDLDAHAAVTRQSSLEGMVLLKNDNATLPIQNNNSKIALLGYTSYDFISGGTGSGSVNAAYSVSLLDGLKNAGYTVDESQKDLYLKGKNDDFSALYGGTRPEEIVPSDKTLESLAASNDLAIITFGRVSGEFSDRSYLDFFLSNNEEELLQKTTDAFHKVGKKVVVILNIGGVIETASWKDIPDAILLAWQPGQEGGNSVADLLSGKKSPSGRLAVTFPVNYEDLGSSENFPIDPDVEIDMRDQRHRVGMHERNIDYTIYEEDIYVGYRWLQKHDIKPSYAFGYGLDYSEFEWTKEAVKTTKDGISATITVKNTGKVAAKDVVELYISAPAGELDKPVMELKAYAKTKELEPGESQTITMIVDNYSLSSFNQKKMQWIADAGRYTALFCKSSEEIKAEVAFDLPKTLSWNAVTTLASK